VPLNCFQRFRRAKEAIPRPKPPPVAGASLQIPRIRPQPMKNSARKSPGSRLQFSVLRHWRKFSANSFSKNVDPTGRVDVGSPRRHDGGRRERDPRVDRGVNHPIGFLVPPRQGSLTVWLSRSRASNGGGSAERKKKIKLCAAHRKGARGRLKQAGGQFGNRLVSNDGPPTGFLRRV